uniref:Uncharacterized protein n=1 Tax=Ananas comosus var. bracteatus TaxID=296719 RepID=A0A6V7PL38_ANACO|nr:unnamed protein product [Ananas comosus var. bracteatus]
MNSLILFCRWSVFLVASKFLLLLSSWESQEIIWKISSTSSMPIEDNNGVDKILSPLSVAPLVALVGFGLYELGFPVLELGFGSLSEGKSLKFGDFERGLRLLGVLGLVVHFTKVSNCQLGTIIDSSHAPVSMFSFQSLRHRRRHGIAARVSRS